MGLRVKFAAGSTLLSLWLLLWPAAAPWALDAPTPTIKPALPASASIMVSRAPTEDQKRLKSAMEALRANKFGQGEAEAAGIGDPLAAKFFTWFEMTFDRPEGDFAKIAAFIEANPNWPRQRSLRRRAETVMPETLSDAQTLRWFKDHPPLTFEGTLAYAGALSRAGMALKATKLVRRNWVALDLEKAEEQEFLRRFGERLRHDDHLQRLDRLLWDKKRGAATRQATRLGGGYPALAKARLKLSLRRRGIDAAIRAVPAELRNDPGLLYLRARWRYRRGDYEGVVALFDPPIEVPPTQTERWWKLRAWVARRALVNGDPALAYRQATAHGFEDGVGFAEGEWLAGWVALRHLNRPSAAYEHFLQLYESVSFPISRARGAYWAGEAARAMGEATWAQRWYAIAAEYRATFYGQLAAHKLDQPLAQHSIQVGSVGDGERQVFEKNELVKVVKLLGVLGERGLQTGFLDRLREAADSAGEFTLVADLALAVDRSERALRTAKTAYARNFWLADYLFPVPFRPGPGSPEPALVLALIRQESAFDPRAISRASARGLMQLLPSTARTVARQIKVPYSRQRLTGDPAYNIKLGRAYISEQIERFGGSYIMAIAAYNAGPHRVDRWIEDFGDPRDQATDPVDWIESIPFSETRNYVQRVLEGMVIYRQFLPGEQTSTPGRPRDPLSLGRRVDPPASPLRG
jgi:soluble lytic murein transglycosylase